MWILEGTLADGTYFSMEFGTREELDAAIDEMSDEHRVGWAVLLEYEVFFAEREKR